jgi:Domain of unknown function (DUF4365)
MPLHDQNLPEVAQTHFGESLSRRVVREKFEQSFIVRIESENDYGVDGTIELIRRDPQSNKALATNRRACFQLKHTSKVANEDGSFKYPIETKNLNYLAACPPAFYVLFVIHTDQLLFRWCQDIYNELLARSDDWRKQSTVSVLFSRPVDHLLIREIATEIDAHAEQVQLLLDGPSFVRHFRSERLPRGLLPTEPFNDRIEELARVATRTARGSILPIMGPAESGKTELVRHYISNPSNIETLRHAMGKPLALLALDVGPRIGRRVLRALSYALGVPKMDLAEATEDAEMTRTILLEEMLPARLGQLSPLTIIENVDECLALAVDRDDLSQLLNAKALQNGSTITIGRRYSLSQLSIRPTIQLPVHVDSLPTMDAKNLLGALCGDPLIASEVIEEAGSFKELLRPGTIKRGAELFRSRLPHNLESPNKELLSEALFDAGTDRVLELSSLLDDKLVLDRPEAIGSWGALIVLAIVSELGVSDELLDLAGLPTLGLRSLVDRGWAEHADSYRLTPTASRALRKELTHILADARRSTELSLIEKGLHSLLAAAGRHPSEAEVRNLVRAIEESLSWLITEGPAAEGLTNQLVMALLPHVVDDLVFPLSVADLERAEEGIAPMSGVNLLDAKILSLVPLARLQNDATRFVECLRETVEIAVKEPEVTAPQIKALDTAAFVGQQRHRRGKETLECRIRLIPKVVGVSASTAREATSTKWIASYILNTAALALTVGELAMAKKLVNDGKAVIDRLPLPNTPYGAADYGTLRARLLSLEAQLSDDRKMRLQNLAEAAQCALFALSNSSGSLFGRRFYLRAVSRLVGQLSDDADRARTLDEALLHLKQEYSDVSGWPLDVRAQAGALARLTASLTADPDERLREANTALELLAPAEREVMAVAQSGDTRPLLVLARTFAFAATCFDAVGEFTDARRSLERATQLVSFALNCHPSTQAWDLKLRLLDDRQLPNLGSRWPIDPLFVSGNWRETKLFKEIEKCRIWLDTQQWGPEEAMLAIGCREREWQQEGSLERWAAATRTGTQSWDDLDNEVRRATLTSKHRARRNQLFSIQGRAGPSVGLFLALARRESQYQRLMAIYGNHVYDPSPTLKYLKEAAKSWPDDQSILAEEAEIYRYVWDYPNAIRLFRKLAVICLDAEQRRAATVSLMDTLLAAATHNDIVDMGHGVSATRVELLSEASAYVPQVTHFRRVAVDVAMLRDRIAFELGQDIDWSQIDAAYASIVGGVNLYVPTVLKNLATLQREESRLAEHIADLVRQDFTSAERIRSMGSLYLRRAEKRAASGGSIADCQRAYGSFDACRILEEAFLGSHRESVTTSFQRGRAILVASTLSQNTNPFLAFLSGKRSLLHLGEALLQRTISLSVGNFHFVARQRASEASQLRAKLERKSS